METHQNSGRDFIIDLAMMSIVDIEKLKFENIKVKSEITFRDDVMFELTIFNNNGGNRSFEFYEFYSKNQNESMYDEVLEIIKKDDFDLIVKFSGC